MTAIRRTAILLPLLAILTMGVIVIGANGAKSIKHPEAVTIRTCYREGLCEGVEVYFSPPRGTLLALCGIPDSNLTGGLIWRIAENYGHAFLGDAAYEVTVFAATRPYWQHVLERDGYLPLAMLPDLERKVREAYMR